MSIEVVLADSAASLRTERLKLAVVTSLGAKVTATALQVFALPLAFRVLGPEQFGVYVMLSTSLSWIAVAGIGVGPSLTIGIAASAARGDRVGESRYLSSALFLVSAVCLLILVFSAGVFSFVGLSDLFDEKYLKYSDQIRPGLMIVGGFFVSQLFLNVIESAQAGYQELYVANVYTLVGNALCAACLVLVVAYRPSILGVVVSLYVVGSVCRLANAGRFLLVSRPYLLPRPSRLDPGITRTLVATGLAFACVEFGSFLTLQSGTLLVGRMLGPTAVAGYAVMMQLYALALSIIRMQAQPLWPALTDAVARGDADWFRAVYRRLVRYSMLYAAVAGSAIALGGRSIIGLWFGPQVAPGYALQAAIGCYFFLNVWEYVHYTILVGVREVWRPAAALTVQGVLTAALTVPSIRLMGAAGAALALCTSTLLVDVWVFPLLTRRAVRRVLGAAPGRPGPDPGAMSWTGDGAREATRP